MFVYLRTQKLQIYVYLPWMTIEYTEKADLFIYCFGASYAVLTLLICRPMYPKPTYVYEAF